MPYIKRERSLTSHSRPSWTIIYKTGDLRYAHINEAIGALECAKLELYRRVAAPYEDEKMKESGDVYRSKSNKDR
jgi:hypothetical protein